MTFEKGAPMTQERQIATAAESAPSGWQAPDVIPTMRYRDAPAAIDWLERAFGFERQAVYEEGGVVHHAQLRLGSGMIMLGSARGEDDTAWPVKVPAEVGATTSGVYVVVEDPDAHHARAKAAGAEILRELTDQDYGSRDYSARDPEGHVWSFGTYRPRSES
jgi:uncharacterized glyoxalase superfamily protein PhnB